MNATIIALLGYISWTLFLLVFLAIYRTMMVTKKDRLPNQFKADGSDITDFGQRLTRAQLNCVESFAFIGGILLTALATNATVITDSLAYFLLVARLGQSLVHLISTSVLAVQVRFLFFLIQVGICAFWLFNLFIKFAN